MEVEESSINKYEQPNTTKRAIKEKIIPFLKESIQGNFYISGNDKKTLLIIDFSRAEKIFYFIENKFEANNFDSFKIPEEIWKTKNDALKTEFINGLFDTAGFPSVGGWLNRKTEKGHGRMRMYFQIVRNWYLTMEIDNFLRGEFSLPIQTIDWGHPNIRDPHLKEYLGGGKVNWSREHQIKIFPEYYEEFHFRLPHKQKLLGELIKHNKKMGFSRREDWFPPINSLNENKIKPYHPAEKDHRIPEPARKHVDAFWQINKALGCNFIKNLMNKSEHPECLLITGEDKKCDLDKIKDKFEKLRKEKLEKYYKKFSNKTEGSSEDNSESLQQTPESDLYAPIKKWLKKYLGEKYNTTAQTFNTSARPLNLFIESKELVTTFNFYENYRIRPDIVGFLPNSKIFIFIEVKRGSTNIKNVGQLLGYCLVANPKEAMLISDEGPTTNLISLIQSDPNLLKYNSESKIRIGTWNNGEVNFKDL